MKLNNDKWITVYKRVVEQTKLQPSSGDVCAVATLLFIRDGLIDDQGGNAKEVTAETKDLCDSLKENFDELITQILTGGGQCPELKGFASNASAAAKAAGYKAQERASALAGLSDLLK